LERTGRPAVSDNELFGLLVRSLDSALRVGGLPIPAILATCAGAIGLVSFVAIAALLSFPWLVTVVGGATSYTLVAASVHLNAWPPRVRAGHELYAWMHVREVNRLPAEALPLPASAEQADAWLRHHPRATATDGLRLELLTWVSRFDDAYEIVERLPADTPMARFQKVAARDFVDFMAGKPGDPRRLEPLVDAIQDPIERAEAEITVAMHSARSRLVRGEDWLEPLTATQRRVRRLTAGTIRKVHFGAVLRQNALYGAIIALLFLGFSPGR
jgi:hypothetical protein